MQNGPFGLRPHASPDIQRQEDVTRPLTRTYESNRGGRVVLDPEWKTKPNNLGTFRGPTKQVGVDIRTDGTNAERFGIVTGLTRPRGVDENNNPRPFCLPGCTPNPAVTEGFFWPHVVGRVEWGMGQAKFEAEFDWKHGTELSVVAETIRVYATYEVTVQPWAGLECKDLPLLSTFNAYSGVGYGNARSVATLTKLAQIQTIGTVQAIRVPPYAKAVTILLVGGTLMTAQAAAVGQAYNTALKTDGTENRLFNGATEILLLNNNTPPGGGPAYAFLVFELSL